MVPRFAFSSSGSPASAQQISETVSTVLGGRAKKVLVALGEVTVLVSSADYLAAATLLRDEAGCKFEQLIDLCGLDYSEYKDGQYDGLRFCVSTHLLSVSLNQRVRLKVFCADDDFPVVDSLTSVWNSANWFEREAFDLFGIIFEGHSAPHRHASSLPRSRQGQTSSARASPSSPS